MAAFNGSRKFDLPVIFVLWIFWNVSQTDPWGAINRSSRVLFLKSNS